VRGRAGEKTGGSLVSFPPFPSHPRQSACFAVDFGDSSCNPLRLHLEQYSRKLRIGINRQPWANMPAVQLCLTIRPRTTFACSAGSATSYHRWVTDTTSQSTGERKTDGSSRPPAQFPVPLPLRIRLTMYPISPSPAPVAAPLTAPLPTPDHTDLDDGLASASATL